MLKCLKWKSTFRKGTGKSVVKQPTWKWVRDSTKVQLRPTFLYSCLHTTTGSGKHLFYSRSTTYKTKPSKEFSLKKKLNGILISLSTKETPKLPILSNCLLPPPTTVNSARKSIHSTSITSYLLHTSLSSNKILSTSISSRYANLFLRRTKKKLSKANLK